MKIVYLGSFLEEGLCSLNHELFPLIIHRDLDFTTAVKEACPNPDIVLLEIWGHIIGSNIRDCPFPLVAYCVDTTLNIYSQAHLLKLFDYVFVDQLSSVKSLKTYGINAHWLPLCVSEKDFRTPAPKPKYGISFVGLQTKHRIKRKNMLSYIQKFYDVYQKEGISCEEMQNIFSNSSIVLNENLFNGFTLRILQGMAAGSLVLTEANMDGVDKYFRDGEHLVYYEPHNLLDKIKDIFARPQHYKKIAAQGQELCFSQHSSKIRATELLSALEDKANANDHKYAYDAQFHEAMHIYYVIQRVGGSFSDSVQIFKQLAQGNSPVASKASYILGDIYSRMNKKDNAQLYYMNALSQCCDKNEEALIYCRLAIFSIAHSEMTQASTFIQNAVKILLPNDEKLVEEISSYTSLPNAKSVLFFLLANLYEILGIDLHLGFIKQEEELYPETAMELALMAWEDGNTKILNFLLKKLMKYNVAGEMLPQLSNAVFAGNVTQEQFILIVEIAKSYYDQDLAYKMICSHKENRQ